MIENFGGNGGGGGGARKFSASYPIRLVLSVWRKKMSLVAVILLTVLLVACLQYSVTKEMVEVSMRQEPDVDELAEDTGGGTGGASRSQQRSVQFLGGEGHLPPTREDVVDVIGRSDDDAAMTRGDDVARRNAGDEAKAPYVPHHRIVHFDLKGAPPKMDYLKAMLPLIKDLGGTGILLEWEDMFPWENNLKSLAAHNAYTAREVKELLAAARKLQLEVIPLVQTFGHVEFALKNQEFAHLREVPESPQALCPSLNSSVELIQDMIDQVMQLHRDVNYLHIGCDEVFNMGECSRCRNKLRDELFLSHVSTVAKYIRNRYPFVKPIIWDDMLRHLPTTTMEQFKIGKLVEPMVWVYAEDIYRFVPQTVWEKYQAVFPSAWTASAFKGAFGETFYVPNVKRHFDNNKNWLLLMAAEDNKFKKGFRGITITGWQRYDHFATLCETLPAAIPSLAVNLLVASRGFFDNSLRKHLTKALGCGVTSSANSFGQDTDSQSLFLNLDNDMFLWYQFSRCSFNGSQFYRLLNRWHNLQREINEYLLSTRVKKAWLTPYNQRHNFSSPLRIRELMADEDRYYHSLLSMIPSISEAMGSVFDEYTVTEWIEQNMYPAVLELELLQRTAQRLRAPKTWPRRPFPPLADLQRLGVPLVADRSSAKG